MTEFKNEFKNEFSNMKDHQAEYHIEAHKVDSRHFLREAHGIQEGVRKDKKIKISKKFK